VLLDASSDPGPSQDDEDDDVFCGLSCVVYSCAEATAMAD
jgi:hypothetical protein